MAALTGDIDLAYENLATRNTLPYPIKNAVQGYVGGLWDVISGVALPHAAGSGTSIKGIATGPGVPGNSPVLDGFTFPIGPSGGSSAIPPGKISGIVGSAAYAAAPQVIIETGKVIVKAVTIATAGTLTGAYTNDVGKVLYCATDNIADASTTQTSSDEPLGHIYQVLSYNSTAATEVVDIELPSAEERANGAS